MDMKVSMNGTRLGQGMSAFIFSIYSQRVALGYRSGVICAVN